MKALWLKKTRKIKVEVDGKLESAIILGSKEGRRVIVCPKRIEDGDQVFVTATWSGMLKIQKSDRITPGWLVRVNTFDKSYGEVWGYGTVFVTEDCVPRLKVEVVDVGKYCPAVSNRQAFDFLIKVNADPCFLLVQKATPSKDRSIICFINGGVYGFKVNDDRDVIEFRNRTGGKIPDMSKFVYDIGINGIVRKGA